MPRPGAAEAFPFADAMAFGLGVLRLSPTDFWAMTIPELVAAVRGLRGRLGLGEPLPRRALARLIARFPDHPDQSSEENA